MVQPLDLVTALLVVFARRFIRRLPYVNATVLNATAPEVSLYRPISFIAGGILYYITKNKLQEFMHIAREYTRRSLSCRSAFRLAQSKLQHRVSDRIEKAKTWSNASFQGPQELQKKSKLFIQNCCKATKLPLAIDNHPVSRFVPTSKTRLLNPDSVSVGSSESSESGPSQINQPAMTSPLDSIPSTSSGITHQLCRPNLRSNNNLSPQRSNNKNSSPLLIPKCLKKVQIQDVLNVRKPKFNKHYSSLTEVKQQRMKKKPVGKIATSSVLAHTYKNILKESESKGSPQNHFGIDDASNEPELIRTTRSGKIYGYRLLTTTTKKRKYRFRT